ncbi:chemotaxis protein CheX [Aliikangiella sp. G2MR2-5]|uniref:chemotaxis protein CheX n=1 Tax=Aliikangiella sp. G2MR2-5 TaxID=2788943 RepID=UPI0018AA41D4|nr:chemotaxis protein CheX [Aliikangiella sp. G2MR2-5]
MTTESDIKSKVIILDDNTLAEEAISNFCEVNSVIGLKAKTASLFDILDGNTDLGGIIMSSTVASNEMQGEELVKAIHYKRPELPIFYRCEKSSLEESPLSETFKRLIAGEFCMENLDKLKADIDSHLFTTYYPMALIRGMQEVSLEAIRSNIRDCEIEVDSPYLVKDRLIFGELMSLIPMESTWYRGYMMIQTTESEIIQAIENGLTPLDINDTDFRFVNSVLNEITNLIWGGIKNRFANYDDDSTDEQAPKTQVPISVNHHHKYISFGTEEPQLCFHYKVKPKKEGLPSIELYQKFIFNLSWYPDNFLNCDSVTEELVESGELEFF